MFLKFFAMKINELIWISRSTEMSLCTPYSVHMRLNSSGETLVGINGYNSFIGR